MTPTQRAAAERLADAVMHPEAAALLRELAAEPVQEPVGWLHDETGDFEPSHKPWMDDDEEWVPLYAAPQQPMRCPEDGGACGAGGYCRPEPQQRSRALADAGFTRRPSLKAMEMRAALEMIAAPMRPDGTWNRDRDACRELAAEVLGRYDDSKTPNVRANLTKGAADE